MKKKILILSILCFSCVKLLSQNYFKETLRKVGDDIANSSVFISEDHVIVVGSTQSGSAPSDGLIIKLDTTGSVLWSKAVGGNGTDILFSTIPLSEGGYLTIGTTDSFGAGNDDWFITKFDEMDNVEWSKTFGGVADDRAYTALQTTDGSLLVGGWTKSFGVGGNNGLLDVMITKLDSDGNLIWSKTYGQSGNDWINFAQFIENDIGNYIISGAWSSGLGISGHNGFIMEVDQAGVIVSSNLYGGGDDEAFNGYLTESGGILQTIDDAWSWGGGLKIWMNEIDNAGNTRWSKTFGVADNNIQYSSATLVGQEYIISAHEINSGHPPILMKVNNNGNLVWSRSFTGQGTDKILSVISHPNRMIMAFGCTEEQGDKDILIIKTNLEGDGDCVQNVNMVESAVVPSISTPNSISSDLNLGLSVSPQINSIDLGEIFSCSSDIRAEFQLNSDSICINGCLSMMDESSGAIDSWEWLFTGANIESTNEQSPSDICFSQPGMQSITLVVSNMAESVSITKQLLVLPEPYVEIDSQGEMTICEGDSLTISASAENADHVLWSTGSTESSIIVNSGGNYWVTASNSCGIVTDQIDISSVFRPSIDLGVDKRICDDAIVLGNEDPNITAYRWSNGSNNSTLEVNESGIYWVEVENSCGIEQDTIELVFPKFDNLNIPNLFTPNGDGLNEHFVVDTRLLGSVLKIFQRTGVMVYKSDNYQNDWNGGKLPDGTYFWSITNECGSNFKGWVTILN